MAKIKFEESLKKLEEIVEELERGDLTLDESLTRYENGIKLYKQCLALLESAERRVQILTKNESGQFQTKDFLPSALSEADEPTDHRNSSPIGGEDGGEIHTP